LSGIEVDARRFESLGDETERDLREAEFFREDRFEDCVKNVHKVMAISSEEACASQRSATNIGYFGCAMISIST
jgi:hypothetical protein